MWSFICFVKIKQYLLTGGSIISCLQFIVNKMKHFTLTYRQQAIMITRKIFFKSTHLRFCRKVRVFLIYLDRSCMCQIVKCHKSQGFKICVSLTKHPLEMN